MRYTNADVVLKENMDVDRFIDAIEANKVYIPGILAINKVDLISEEEKNHLQETLKPDMFISGHKKINMTELLDLIYDRLNFIRIYLKEVKKKPDMEEPLIMRKGTTIKDICNKLHRDFVKRFKYVRIWGPSAKFDGQMIKNLRREVKDGDVVEIHLI